MNNLGTIINHQSNLVEMAVRFQVDEDVFVEKCGKDRWCVVIFSSVLDRNLVRHYASLPSNTTEEFINNTQFTLEEALQLADRYSKL
jgi:hypothetical protein